MAILTLGISYRRAPIELLERLSYADDELAKAYRHALDSGAVEEAVVLSTCNRVEVYASVGSYHAGFLALKRLLVETKGVDADDLSEPLYAHWERDATEHLLEVAAGLDSMVLGETQILVQVRDALRKAQAEDAAGPSLSALFQAASRAGRRVRAETSLGRASDAFVALGASLAEASLGGLEGRDVVVVGAGRMAALAVEHLRRRGAGSIRILNRSIERARALANRTHASHGDLKDLFEVLADVDLVISATGAAGVVLSSPSVEEALPARGGRPLVLVDLAIPRDVDPAVSELPGVRLFDIVAIRDRIADHDPATDEEIARAREIVHEEVDRFATRRRADALAPLIRALRARGDDVVRGEFERHGPRLAELTSDERAAVEALARGIAAKLLHDPIVGLKERGEPGTHGAHARLLMELLGIELSEE